MRAVQERANVLHHHEQIQYEEQKQEQVSVTKATIENMKPSLAKELTSTVKSCKKILTDINSSSVLNKSETNQENKQAVEQVLEQEHQSESTSDVNSTDIKNIEEELDNMLKEYKDNNSKLEDIVCEENYKKKQEFKEKEREKERRNIFSADLKMYKQLFDDLEEINKYNVEKEIPEKKIYDIVPVLFLAKFYVIEFIEQNDYLLDEDFESPSEELYQLYTMLYSIKYNPKNEDNILDKYDEEFYELINEFLEATENKHAPDENIIREELNKKSDVLAML